MDAAAIAAEVAVGVEALRRLQQLWRFQFDQVLPEVAAIEAVGVSSEVGAGIRGDEKGEETSEAGDLVEVEVRPEFTRESSSSMEFKHHCEITLVCRAPGGVPDPNPEVEKIENCIEDEVLKTKPARSDSLFPLRPGFGTQGRKVILYANYFELSTDSRQVLFRYNTEILPDQAGRKPSQRKAKQIIQLFLDQHLLQYQNNIASDYRSNIISQIELPLQPGRHDVQYRAPDEDEPPANPQIYHVRFQFTGKLMVSELLDYLTSTNASAVFQSKEELLQALNIVMGHYPKREPLIASVGSVGTKKHLSLQPDEQDRLSLGGGLEVLRGFFVSVRAATARLLVNVQVKNIACYEEGELKAVITAANLSNTYKLEGFLKTVRVRVTHLQSKKPRIKSISALATPRDGRNLAHPPIVQRHGAGPRHVKFWLESRGPDQGPSEQSSSKAEGKGKKGKKPPKAGPEQEGKYISVAEYFLQSKSTLLSGLYENENS